MHMRGWNASLIAVKWTTNKTRQPLLFGEAVMKPMGAWRLYFEW